MLVDVRARVTGETKNANPATKIMSQLLNGFVQKRRVRCGKSNCKCARGALHTAFYRVWYDEGRRFQQYVRGSELEAVRAACDSHRELQKQLRKGRGEYKQLIARACQLLKVLSI